MKYLSGENRSRKTKKNSLIHSHSHQNKNENERANAHNQLHLGGTKGKKGSAEPTTPHPKKRGEERQMKERRTGRMGAPMGKGEVKTRKKSKYEER
jgi:hypothetical protein